MSTTRLRYEAPVIALAGDFAEVTHGSCCGRWFDFPGYFDL